MLAGYKMTAADKDQKFAVGPATSYPGHQTNEKVTIGVQAFVSDEDTKPAFGKNNPYKYGVLPVLMVIQNNSDKAIHIEELEAQYIPPGGGRVEATPAQDVRYLSAPGKPKMIPGPTGTPKVLKRKNPLGSWEIEGRGFSAKMIPPGEAASGFVYFQTGFQRSSKIYLSGLKEAGSNRELFYFEIPLAER